MRVLRPTSASFSGRRRALVWLGAALTAAAMGSGRAVRADEPPSFRVIVHSSNPQKSVEKTFVADAFLKKVTRWADGEVIRAVDLHADSGVRRRFSEAVLKRTVVAVRSYWQQRIFSGRDVPPPELESEDNVVAFVAKYPGAIGYVSGAAKLVGVRELALE
ncbi:MAG TPA: hypothetical protein VNG33_22975 [Polyangiaceae bacterium]|nr:hypothetical protein [Polyangiaceae bacterium]